MSNPPLITTAFCLHVLPIELRGQRATVLHGVSLTNIGYSYQTKLSY